MSQRCCVFHFDKEGSRQTNIAIKFGFLFIMITCFVLQAQPVHAHWCETSKQSTAIERAICNDAGLLNNDIELNYLYSLLGGSQNRDLQLTQRSWIKTRNGCTNMNCLRVFYEDRLRVLRAMAGVDMKPRESAQPAQPESRQNDVPSRDEVDQDELPDIQPF